MSFTCTIFAEFNAWYGFSDLYSINICQISIFELQYRRLYRDMQPLAKLNFKIHYVVSRFKTLYFSLNFFMADELRMMMPLQGLNSIATHNQEMLKI